MWTSHFFSRRHCFGVFVCLIWSVFLSCLAKSVLRVSHAESESMASRRRVAACGMAPCVARSPTTVRAVASGKQPAASTSVWMFNAPRKPQVQDVQRPMRTPEETQAMAATKVQSYRSRHCSIGRRRWRRVGHSASAVPDCRLRFLQWRSVSPIVPSSSKGPRRGQRRRAQHCRKQWNFKRQCDDEVAAAERRLEALQREDARSDVVFINGVSIRWPSCEAVSAGGFRAPLRRGNAEWMQERHADLPSGRCGRTSPGSGEGFPAHRHCCSGVAGVDQPTVSCNAIFRCKCRRISVAVMQFSSMRLRRRWGSRGVRIGEASHPGPSSPRRQSRFLKREGPFRRCRPTQIDSDCEPLVNRGRFGVLSSDSDDEGLAVSGLPRTTHAMERGHRRARE